MTYPLGSNSSAVAFVDHDRQYLCVNTPFSCRFHVSRSACLALSAGILVSQGTPGDSGSPTAGPTYLAAAASPTNTICKTVNMTATQAIEIRNFMFYVDTTDCISVSVHYKGENDTLWTPMCLEHDVWGQHPNATVVDPAYCSMISVLSDETVQFRVQTSPSNGCVYGEGAVQHENLDLGALYIYSETECS